MLNFTKNYLNDISQLIVIVNPIMMLAIFIGYVLERSLRQARRIALISSTTVLFTLLITAWIGPILLSFLGISLASLQIAGGLVLLIPCLKQLNASSDTCMTKGDISFGVVPLGFPIMSGPAAMAKLIDLSGSTKDAFLMNDLIITLTIITLSLLLGTILYFYNVIIKFLGKNTLTVMKQLSFLMLACISVGMFFQGVEVFIKN